jgi:hypothetical protein
MVKIQKGVIFASFSVAVIVLLAWNFIEFDTTKIRLRNEPEASELMSRHNSAIVLINIGNFSQTTIVDELIEGLSGRTSLPIYVLTSKPSCIDTKAYKSGNASTIFVPVAHASRINITIFKTMVFQYIPAHIQNVLYLDRDVRVTDALSRWPLPSLASYSGCDLLLSPERFAMGESIICDWNNGVMVMHRTQSKQCLDDWRTTIHQGTYWNDQVALQDTADAGKCRLCPLPGDPVTFSKTFFTMFKLAWGIKAFDKPFIHYTSSTHNTDSSRKELCQNPSKYLYQLNCWFDSLNLHPQEKNC